MGFLNPWLLLGLVAAGVPIAIHLLRQRQAPVVSFGPMELLLRVERRVRSRLRLRDLLLLAARVLLVALLVLAAARPFVRVASRAAFAAAMPSSIVIVLDDSLSMQAGAAFARAKAAALDVVLGLGSDDNAALVLAGAPARARLGLGFDPGKLRGAIDELVPTYRGGDLEGALDVARKILEGSAQPARRIVVISDMARHAWPEAARRFEPGAGVDLRVVDVGAPRPPNAAITAVTARPAPEVGQDVWALQATVANFGPRPLEEAVVTLHVAGSAVARGFVDVPAGGSATKTFLHGFGGELRAEVRLVEDDLAADDVRFVQLDVARPRRLLVVDGDPRPARYDDEVFYLVRALGALGITPTIADAEALEGHRFADHDAVLLCNAVALPEARLDELAAMVRAGGGLLVTAGDRTAGRSWPRALTELLGLSVGAAEAGTAAFRFARPDGRLPIASAFPSGGAGLGSSRVARRLAVEASDRSVRVPLAFEDGRPALTLRPVGEGRAALLATTIDRDWGDLPIRPAFVVLVRALVDELTGTGGGSGPAHARPVREIRPGVARELRPAGEVRRLVVETPGGGSRDLGGTVPASFRGTERPGFYRVLVERARGGLSEDAASSFVVNPDPRESDLRPARSTPARPSGAGGWLAAPVGRRSVPIAPTLLAIVPVIVIAESLLRRR